MSEVKRFKPVINSTPYKPYAYCEENEEGLYVRIQDYVALKAERDALAANEGYKQAFYEIANILGTGARPDSPKDVFEQVIKPMLINLTKESGQPATENAALLTRLRNIEEAK